MTMDAKTASALEASIAHWLRLWKMPAKEIRAMGPHHPDRISRHSCDLCKLFWNWGDCGECPVAQRTGRHCCSHTPYHEAEKAFTAYRQGYGTLRAWRRVARAELRFLEGLREKG